MTYSQRLRDPRWQKLRLMIFDRDGWRCQRENCQSPENSTLAVHHKSYVPGRDPWDYPLTNFETLCEKCHERVHESGLSADRLLKEGVIYSWGELPGLLGFEPYKYLTEQDGRIVCACIRLDYNPDAPDIVLPGDDAGIVARSRKFAGQKEFIPVFIKAVDAGWEYCGRWRVQASTNNAVEVRLHQDRAKDRKVPISMVLFLEREASPGSVAG